jgi:hypothetical protein
VEVLITQSSEAAEGHVVAFECKAGGARALWIGRPPTVGETRYVEVELEAPLVMGKDITKTAEPIGIALDEDMTVVVGTLTEVQDDGYARLDFGSGEVDLEIVGERPPVDVRFRVATRRLKLFDCDY